MVYFHQGDGRQIEQTLQEFCRDVIRKNHEQYSKNKKFSREVFKQMGELGLLGAMIPEEYGGVGMNMRNYIILMESLAYYGGGSIALTLIAHHSLASMHILYAGTEDQKKLFLPQLASGTQIAAWCLTEPGSGSDVFGGMKTVATNLFDKSWFINGSKLFITNGSIADIYVVIAKIHSKVLKPINYGAFIIPGTAKGFIECRAETNKMGMSASDTSAVDFREIEIGWDMKIGGDGKLSTRKVLNNSRIGISALACGLMRSSIDEAIIYAKQRKSFGKPIAEYQGVSFPLADASAELAACWAMVQNAAKAVDDCALTPKMSAETKLKTTGSAFNACLSSLLTFGGLGFMMDSRVAQNFTSALLLRIGEGTDNIQRLTISRSLFSD